MSSPQTTVVETKNGQVQISTAMADRDQIGLLVGRNGDAIGCLLSRAQALDIADRLRASAELSPAP